MAYTIAKRSATATTPIMNNTSNKQKKKKNIHTHKK